MHRYRLLTSHDYDPDLTTTIVTNNYVKSLQWFKVLWSTKKCWTSFLRIGFSRSWFTIANIPCYCGSSSFVWGKNSGLFYLVICLRRQTKLTYTGVARALDKRIQCARYEEFMLSQASAYKGYNIDFPAGRIYRTGFLHFHERDNAKCLICFVNPSLKGGGNYTNHFNDWRLPEQGRVAETSILLS